MYTKNQHFSSLRNSIHSASTNLIEFEIKEERTNESRNQQVFATKPAADIKWYIILKKTEYHYASFHPV